MTVEQTVSASVGVLSAVASATLQATGQQGGLTAPVVSAIIGAAVSYGVLRGTVVALERDTKQLREDMHAMRDTMQHVAEKVARIEGTMERRGAPRG